MFRYATHMFTALFALFATACPASDSWPSWRGPQGNPYVGSGSYPVEFSAANKVIWKVALPGLGCSTPAVWDDFIFVTSGIDGQDGACCYDFRGKLRWKVQLGPERRGKHRNGSGSNPSPVTDGTHVVVYYKSGTVATLDFGGKVVWQRNLQKQFGNDTLWWDLGTSPVLAGGRIVIAVMQDGDSYLVALDPRTGDVAWKQPRVFTCGRESDQSYTTPTVVTDDGRDVIVTWGADHLTAHDAASGNQLCTCSGVNPDKNPMWRTIASAAVTRNMAVVPYGRGELLAGVRLGGTTANRVWRKQGLGSDVPTPLAVDGKVYVLTDRGRLVYIELASGRQLWSADLPRSRAKYYASPVLAGHNLYCAREDGMVFVGDVRDGFQLVAENDMGERIVATPVPIRGSLLVRGDDHLFRIGR
jgi:outer membrane protein assembly factor BamB